MAEEEGRKIFVAFDGSFMSRLALRYAELLMDKSKDTLECVVAMKSEPVDLLGVDAVSDVPDFGTWGIPSETKEKAMAIESELVSHFAEVNLQNSKVHLVSAIDVGDAICVLANQTKASLVVTGTRSLDTLSRMLQGSTSDKLLHEAQSPVLVIHYEDSLPPEAGERIKWAVGVDGTEESLYAFSEAKKLARSSDLFLLVKVVETGVDRIQEENGLQFMIRQLDAAQIPHQVKIVEGHKPAEAMIKFVDAEKPNFLVVGSRNLDAFSRFFFGSVSDECARNAKCPVLVVKKN